jgi:hypothetical protein
MLILNMSILGYFCPSLCLSRQLTTRSQRLHENRKQTSSGTSVVPPCFNSLVSVFLKSAGFCQKLNIAWLYRYGEIAVSFFSRLRLFKVFAHLCRIFTWKLPIFRFGICRREFNYKERYTRVKISTCCIPLSWIDISSQIFFSLRVLFSRNVSRNFGNWSLKLQVHRNWPWPYIGLIDYTIVGPHPRRSLPARSPWSSDSYFSKYHPRHNTWYP